MGFTGQHRVRGAAALAALDRAARTGLSVQEVIEEISRLVVSVIHADAHLATVTDPKTGLSLGPTAMNAAGEGACQPFWEHELLVADYNKFAELTVADPVADLRQATGGQLTRSARYRMQNAMSGLADELRAVLPAAGRSWGNLQLSRHDDERPFSDDDRDFLRAAAPLAGTAIRCALLGEPAKPDPARGPGIVVVDETGAVLSATAEAGAWLDELAAGWRDHTGYRGLHPELLLMSLGTLSHPESPARRARVRTPGGTWLIVHAAPLGETRQVGIVVQPAKAAEIAPVIVEAYRLTAREIEVTRLVGRGLNTGEIAAALFMSRHTVRDHLKAIFDKTGVGSRGELTWKLFAES